VAAVKLPLYQRVLKLTKTPEKKTLTKKNLKLCFLIQLKNLTLTPLIYVHNLYVNFYGLL